MPTRDPVFAQCLIWFFYRLAKNKDLNLFLDREDEDLIIHTFLVGQEPPIHRAKRIPGLFNDYEQASELIKKSKKESKEDLFDAEFITALTLDLDLEVLTASKQGLKIRTGDYEITDLDGYIPEKNIWIEITAQKSVDSHFFDKLGRLTFCREQTVILETLEFDLETTKDLPKRREVSMKDLKLFHVGLYPLDFRPQNPLIFKNFSLLDDKNPSKIRRFILHDRFEALLNKRFRNIQEELKKFCF